MSERDIVLSGAAFRGLRRMERRMLAVWGSEGNEAVGGKGVYELREARDWLGLMARAGMGREEGPELRWRTEWPSG